jgi:hypothetical protein
VQTVLFLAFAILYISGSYKVHHFVGAEARNKMLKHEGGVILSLSLSDLAIRLACSSSLFNNIHNGERETNPYRREDLPPE